MSEIIGAYFANDKARRVRTAAMGAKVNLWRAVNLVKNVNNNTIPKNLTLGGVPIVEGCVSESFAKFFHGKIKINVQTTMINPD